MKINFKKLLIQIYFIFFILLNIIDFSNLFNIFGNLGNDLDFFKKLLSWSLIGYIFYKVSLTKIFIGKKIKKYDIFLIIAFSFMTIIKSLVLYVINNPPQNFVIFKYFLSKIPTIGQTGNLFVLYTFLIGLIFIIILSILILKNNSPLKNSLIGSINFSDYLKFLKFDYISLILFSIFFGLIVFNFFMEWFALAVDSIILVAGLIYYLIKYIHNHTSGKISKFLKNVSNTGNLFFKNLIEKFSSKKTIFIGVAFLLTLHLIVDIGVYLIPYTIGTQNTLYSNNNFENLITHNSLFNILSFNEKLIESNFSKDYNYLKNEPLILFIVFIFYLLYLFFFYFLMFMPFYIFYKNFNNSKIEIKKIFVILFLSSLVLISILFTITDISSPIFIKMHNSLSVYGVDIQTSYITENINLDNYDNKIFTILSLFLIYIVVLFFLLFKYYKYQIYFNKIIFLVILIFFIYYISIFFISTINIELKQLKNNFLNNENVILDNLKYKELENLFLNETTIKDIQNYSRTTLSKNYNLNIIPFYNLENFNKHIDYFKIDLFNINKNGYYYFNDSYLIYVNSEDYNLNTKQFNKEKSTIYLFLGENKFNLDKNGKIEYTNKNNFINENIGNLLKYTISKKTIQIPISNYIQRFIQYLRIIFVSIFYIFGTVHFSIYYLKKNLF